MLSFNGLSVVRHSFHKLTDLLRKRILHKCQPNSKESWKEVEFRKIFWSVKLQLNLSSGPNGNSLGIE